MCRKDVFNIDFSMKWRKFLTEIFNIFSFSSCSQHNLNSIFNSVYGKNIGISFDARFQHIIIILIISVYKCSEYQFTFARKIGEFFKMLMNLLIINTIEIAQFSQFRQWCQS